jgi:hypothetical protein
MNTMIENINIHLISSSNSWWIKNIVFGEIKLILGASLRLRKKNLSTRALKERTKDRHTIMNL